MDYQIDPGALARVLRLGGPGLLARLVEAALGNLAVRCGELAAARDGGDDAAGERAAHSIKSSAVNVGATSLARAAEEAEALARRGDPAWPAAAGVLLEADLGALRESVERAAALAAEGAL